MAEAASSGLVGTLYVRLMGQTDDLNNKMKDSEEKVKKHTKGMEVAAESLTHVLEALGLAFSIAEIVSFAKETIHAADEIKKLSQEIDMSIDKVAGLKFAADKANIGESLEQGMRKFAMGFRQAQVEGSEMQHFFHDMGIDVSHGMNDAFDQVAEQLSKMKDGVDKTGAAQELFGMRQARFVNLFAHGAEGIKKDVADLAKVTGMSYEDAAKKSEEFHDSMVTLKYAFQGIAMSVLTELLPPLTEFIGWVTGTAVPAVKAFFGEVSQGFVEAGGLEVWKEFTGLLSNAWDLIKIGLGYFASLFETITGTTSVAKGLGVALVTVLATFRDLFSFAIKGIDVVGIGLLGLLEGLMKIGRWIAEKLVVAFEFWANAGIKAINFLIDGFNSMSDRLPQWIKNRLGIGDGGPAIQPIELFHLGKPSGLDDWIDIVTDARKDLQKQLSVDFTQTAKTIDEGTKEVVEAAKKAQTEIVNAISPEISKKMHADLDKIVGTDDMEGARGFRKTLGGLGEFTSGGKQFHTAGMQDMAGATEASQLLQERSEIDETLKDIQRIRESHIKISAEQQKRLTQLEEAEGRKRHATAVQLAHLELQTASSMFGDLATIAKAWAGEQSGIYKAMFVASKAFAIADATVKIAQGIAAAAANPWPENLFAMASVIAATASIVSSIQAVTLEFGGGKAAGGPVDAGKAYIVGEQGQELFVPKSNGSIIPNNKMGGGSNVQVNVYNQFGGEANVEVQQKDQGDQKILDIYVRKAVKEVGAQIRDGRGEVTQSLQSAYPTLKRGGK
jgi:hypothetical protein